jgi:Tol biopolymer transport system component
MTLATGSRLGPYEILAPLGAGGMGEVWRARDTKLGRDVALKVLPQALAQDAERLERFEREAQLLAALNHPHIAAIYGVEDSTATKALVLELVEGPTLQDRIAQGALPLEEAVGIARQVAEALEAAHDKGIVHRDLKPANVKVTQDGSVKVLDFGLAKALDPAGMSAAPTTSPTIMNSPTLTSAGTQLGVILGTAAYMSPEQAKGFTVDRRADIWAFGVVLHEMLSGERLFAGDSVAETLAGVLKTTLDFTNLPASTPAEIRRLLRRCLERNPKNRLHDVADARLVLEEVAGGRTDDAPTAAIVPILAPPSRRFRSIAWLVAGLALGAAAAWLLRARLATPAPVLAFTVTPSTTGLVEDFPAFSPDGRQLAYVLRDAQGATALWLHSLETGEARRLANTEGAQEPFWSPDGRFIGFAARGQLRRVDVATGTSQTICAASDPRGAAWSQQGEILFTPNSAAALWRVPAAGGDPQPATERVGGEQSHRFPWFLPDGRHVLFTVIGDPASAGIYVGDLDKKTRRRLVPDPSRSAYDERGFLIFARQGSLVAQPFDAGRSEISGEPTLLASKVGIDPQKTGKTWLAAARRGFVAWRVGVQAPRQLAWFDRAGRALGNATATADYAEPSLSPDESRVAVGVVSTERDARDIWVFEARTMSRGQRLTFGKGDYQTPVWTPDGKSLIFSRNIGGQWAIVRKLASGEGEERVIAENSTAGWPDDVSRDGRFLVGEGNEEPDGYGLWMVPLAEGGKPAPFAPSPASEAHAMFSPDGHFIAYASDQSGVPEVYVQTVPPSGSKWQISTQGGDLPIWRADGKEILYASPSRVVMAVPIQSLDPFSAGEPTALFSPAIPQLSVTGNRTQFLVTRDGQRVLVNLLVGGEAEPGIHVLANWRPTP